MNAESKIKEIISGKTGDIKLNKNVPYTKTVRRVVGFYSCCKCIYKTYKIETYRDIITGKYIKVFVYNNRICKVGFSGIKDLDNLTSRQKKRLLEENAMKKPRFRNAFKNYQAFKGRAYCEFKKEFNNKDLVKVVALLRLYNELYLMNDVKGCKQIINAVKKLQLKNE